MNQALQDERELLSKPGEAILETLEHLKMSQSELATRLGKTTSKINDIISAKEPISITTALLLEKVLGIDATFWNNRERQYREKLSRIEELEMFETSVSWLKLQPHKQLYDYGYLKTKSVGPEMVAECLQFYGIASPLQWTSLYVEKATGVMYRKSPAHQIVLGSIAAWLRIGEIEKQKLILPEFNKEIFKECFPSILSLVKKHPEDFAQKLKSICANAGVAIIYTACFPGAPLSGAARWIGGNPLIQLTDRYKTNDQFWFTFFHEAGHILLHGKKELFLEEFEGYEFNDGKEEEANQFAANQLLPAVFLNDLNENKITENDIRLVARKYQTHPGIVLGRLRRLKKIPFNFQNNLFAKINLEEYTKQKEGGVM